MAFSLAIRVRIGHVVHVKDYGISKLPTACNDVLVHSVTQMYAFHAEHHHTCDVVVGTCPAPVTGGSFLLPCCPREDPGRSRSPFADQHRNDFCWYTDVLQARCTRFMLEHHHTCDVVVELLRVVALVFESWPDIVFTFVRVPVGRCLARRSPVA